ncbi:MAG: hypothetical protein AAGI03_05245 [Pseudomonadota bacterium]
MDDVVPPQTPNNPDQEGPDLPNTLDELYDWLDCEGPNLPSGEVDEDTREWATLMAILNTLIMQDPRFGDGRLDSMNRLLARLQTKSMQRSAVGRPPIPYPQLLLRAFSIAAIEVLLSEGMLSTEATRMIVHGLNNNKTFVARLGKVASRDIENWRHTWRHRKEYEKASEDKLIFDPMLSNYIKLFKCEFSEYKERSYEDADSRDNSRIIDFYIEFLVRKLDTD